MVILKPYKETRQKNESEKDARELVRHVVSEISQSSLISEPIIHVNDISESDNILNDSSILADAILENQHQIGIDDNIRSGKKAYALKYVMYKDEMPISVNSASIMAKDLLTKLYKYTGAAIVSETDKEIDITVVMSNYPMDYEVSGRKMTNDYKPYFISNSYNKIYSRKSTNL